MIPRLWILDKFELYVHLFLKILLPDPALLLVFIFVLKLPGFSADFCKIKHNPNLGHTAVYQFFVDMLKLFDKEDLQQLWTLVKETLQDVFVKVGKFHFLADFIVVDFDTDPRVPLILERSFLKTEKALIDVFEGELTLRVGKEAITFNLDQTSRYTANYNDMTLNRIDVIDMACEEYSQEVLSFSDLIGSGNPTSYYDPIISTSSPTLTPFGDSDFLLKEVNAFLALEDDATLPELDHSYYDPEGDILLLEAFQ
nr:reverse transcriptase domain-containing protein [Tanacetum cinerariifolium]